MPTIRFDKLIDHYLPTYAPDSPHFHPENVQELSSELGDDGLLHIDESVALDDQGVPFTQLAFLSHSDDGTTNQKVYYLNLIGEQTATSPLTIVSDITASNARALKVTAGHVLVFKTSYPYNPQTLKKMMVRLKAVVEGDIRIGMVGISDKAYIRPNGDAGFPKSGVDIADYNDFYELVVSASNIPVIADGYSTITGYFKGMVDEPLTDANPYSGVAQTFPADAPDYPYALRTDTTDVAMCIKCVTGEYYVDSLELFDVENAIVDIPGGAGVVADIEAVEDAVITSNKCGMKPNYSAYPFTTVANKYGYVCGYDMYGVLSGEDGFVYHPSTGILMTLVAGVVDASGFGTASGQRLTILYDLVATTYTVARYSPDDAAYVDSSGTAISTTNKMIVGYCVVDSSSMISASILPTARSIAQGYVDERQFIMDYLNVSDPASFTARATAMGFTNVFTSLAVYEAFINSLTVISLSVQDNGYQVDINATDGIKASFTEGAVTTDVFRSYPNGNMELGKYSAVTKAGGIFYDYANDKLLGNVAYDQWDLVIESDVDLVNLYQPSIWADASLYPAGTRVLGSDAFVYVCILEHTSSSTTAPITGVDYATYWQIVAYNNVVIAPNMYTFVSTLALDSYQVQRFIGVAGNVTITNSSSGASPMIRGGGTGYITEIGNLNLYNTSATATTFISINSANSAHIHDVIITGNSSGTGLYSTVVVGENRKTVERVRVTDVEYGIRGFDSVFSVYIESSIIGVQDGHVFSSRVVGANIGIDDADSVTSCIIMTCNTGIRSSYCIANCFTNNCDTGIYGCTGVTSTQCFCESGSSGTDGIRACNGVVGCDVAFYTRGFYLDNSVSGCGTSNCTTGFTTCSMLSASRAVFGTTGITGSSFVSATSAYSNTTNWGTGNTKVDADSCNV